MSASSELKRTPDVGARERVAAILREFRHVVGGCLHSERERQEEHFADRILAALTEQETGEITKLREALRWCAATTWEGVSIEGYDFQDMMIAAGLMVRVPADEAFRAEWEADEMNVLAWSNLARTPSTTGEKP